MFSLKTKGKKVPSTTDLISDVVTAWVKRARTKDAPRGAFVLDESPLADADLGDTSGLLPLVMWHADNLYRYGINDKGLGVLFNPDAAALLARSVSLERVNRSSAEILCFTIEALEDARTNLPKSRVVKGAVELRTLANRFTDSFGVSPISVPDTPAVGPVKRQA